jgi:predicted phage terminase large subunit-like protein
MTILKPAEYNALLRTDLYSFIQACFYELHPTTPFQGNWHLELIAAKLWACQQGKIKRLVINVPPRSLKSLCASVALPAFWLGHDPSARILAVSYGQDLADNFSRDCLKIIASPRYQALFPTRLSPLRQSVHEFTTTAQGYRLAVSIGGPVTGRGGDLIIIDDPQKPNEVHSEVKRQSAIEFYRSNLYSRLNNKVDGCIALIMQRLHDNDMTAYVLEQEGWEVVSLPAIAEVDEEFIVDTPLGVRRFTRRAGEALHPARESLATLEQNRLIYGEYVFASQYQQRPAPIGGGIVKGIWFKRFEAGDLPEKFDKILQSWDTATKETELADFSVCTTWGIKDRNIYLLNVLRKRLNYPELKRTVREQWQAFKADVVLIEDKSSGTQLIQEMVHEGLHAVTAHMPTQNKIMRLSAQTGLIENGFVYLPSEAHWLGEYLHELQSFPKGRHDDQVDSTAQALEWFKMSAWEFGAGWMEYIRGEIARNQGLAMP